MCSISKILSSIENGIRHSYRFFLYSITIIYSFNWLGLLIRLKMFQAFNSADILKYDPVLCVYVCMSVCDLLV